MWRYALAASLVGVRLVAAAVMVEQTELDNGQPVDTFIGVRPIPVMACGLSGPIRNTIDVVVRDVEVSRNARKEI